MTDDADREAFEAHFPNLNHEKIKDGSWPEVYAHPHVESIWFGWQAALAHARQPGEPAAEFSSATILPDGSAFATASFPLPKDHWIYGMGNGNPPMPLRMGEGPDRQAMVEKVRAAARYAVRASTMNGRDDDFDPDALVQNMVVGLLGYFSPDGTSGEDWGNPKPLPPLYTAAHPAPPAPVAVPEDDALLALPCDEQHRLATMLAGNVGYELVEEPEHPDSPHRMPPAGYALVPCNPSYKQLCKLGSEWACNVEEANEAYGTILDICGKPAAPTYPAGGDVRAETPVLDAFCAALATLPAEPEGETPKTVKMLVSADWLRRKIEEDPDLPCEAGSGCQTEFQFRLALAEMPNGAVQLIALRGGMAGATPIGEIYSHENDPVGVATRLAELWNSALSPAPAAEDAFRPTHYEPSSSMPVQVIADVMARVPSNLGFARKINNGDRLTIFRDAVGQSFARFGDDFSKRFRPLPTDKEG